MISKNKSKFIVSLQKKKIREKERLFVIEGDKLVREFLEAGITINTILANNEFIDSLSSKMKSYIIEIIDVSFEELKNISTLKSPYNAIAVVPFFKNSFEGSALPDELCVALDCIQDPGNFGTIIRAAAWFGIKNIVCSKDCVDMYNPKVIQASMGAIMHVNITYYDLKAFITQANRKEIPVFGTLLTGESVYNKSLDKKGIILLGNESKGISQELIPFITEKISIPGANRKIPGIESLNVGMAASIIFSEFFRKLISKTT